MAQQTTTQQRNLQSAVRDWLARTRLARPQHHGPVTVFPLLTSSNHPFLYAGLDETLKAESLAITETSNRGSVHEILVRNEGELPVLVLDGEELIGAKQNRVFNATLLLPPKAPQIVPVSSSEPGRWNWKTAFFCSSDHLFERSLRARQSRLVTGSLRREAGFIADQETLREHLQRLQQQIPAVSTTHALLDTFQHQAHPLNQALRAFPRHDLQTGLLVLHDGIVVGLDLVSRPWVYAGLHGKLIRSYLLEVTLQPPPPQVLLQDSLPAARAFLDQLTAAVEEASPSIGWGTQLRYTLPHITGSALLHNGHPLHASFLRDPLESNHRRPG